MSEQKERDAFEAWLATSAQDIAGDDWSTENIWLGGYRAAIAPAVRERDLAALMHPAVAGMPPAGAIGWLAIELDAVQSGGEPVAELIVGPDAKVRDIELRAGISTSLAEGVYELVIAAPAPVASPAALTGWSITKRDTGDWIVLSPTGRRWVAYAESNSAELIEALLAAQPAASASLDRQGVALSDEPSWIEQISAAVPEWNKLLAVRGMTMAELPKDRVECYMIACIERHSLYTPKVFDPLYSIVYQDGADKPDAPYLSSKDVFALRKKRDELRAEFKHVSYEIIPVCQAKEQS